jgi:hypothetical protein
VLARPCDMWVNVWVPNGGRCAIIWWTYNKPLEAWILPTNQGLWGMQAKVCKLMR